MASHFDDWMLDDSEGMDDAPVDPFDGVGKRDQDLFFKVLDVIPDDKREAAMDYFLDHPAKIRSVIAQVKQKKQLIEDKDIAGLNKLFEAERVAFEKADALAVAEAMGASDTEY